jgi:tetratricopeptide (TPR) repeat protein
MEKNLINVLGEYGGLALEIKNHTWEGDNWGYEELIDKDELTYYYKEFIDMLIDYVKTGFSAAIFTQTTDVETEPAVEAEAPQEKPAPETVDVPKPEPEKLVEKVPEVAPEPANIVFAKQLQVLLDQGRVKDAIALYDEIPSELAEDIDLMIVLASLYVSDSQYDMAIRTADRVLAKDPSNLSALEIKTLCAKAKGDTSAYKSASKAILAVDPYNAQVNIMEGDEQALNHKWKLARDAYTKALKSEPENEDALYGYAKMTYYMDDLKLAKSTCQALLDKNPQNSEALALMGKLAAEDMNYVRAIKLTQDALVYDPDNYDFYLDIGTYYRYQGKYTEAAKTGIKL